MGPKLKLKIVGLVLIELGILGAIKARIDELKEVNKHHNGVVDMIRTAYRSAERLQKIVDDPEMDGRDLILAMREEQTFLDIIREELAKDYK